MRLVDLRLTRFGAFEDRSLSFGGEPGLVVVYGPNEAGKSTALAAISDFLFGVPERTAHGAIFGGDAIRIAATVQPQAGSAVSLVRRKGRTRTLMDETGAPADEAQLSRLLGGTGRTRFETLFGLDHERLRSGGDSLLSVEGDIGRLIVEAGGGLRTLIDRLTGLDQEIDGLFDTRRKESRLFYQALDAFEAAAAAAKSGAVSIDVFERQQAEVARAQEALEALNARRIELAAEANRLQRLVRVAPILRNLDQLRRELEEHRELPVLSKDYESHASAAIAETRAAISDLSKARGSRDVLKARLEGLPQDIGLAAFEAAIRDAAEQAIHVSKARDDRPGREAELAASRAQLASLRGRLALGEADDLAARLPRPEAVSRVQSMVTAAERRSAQIEAAGARVRDLKAEADTAAQEMRKALEKGWDQPLGVRVADLAALPAAVLGSEQRRRGVEADLQRAAERAKRLGFADVDELTATPFPSFEDLNAEITARDRLQGEQTRLIAARRDAEESLGQATATLEALTKGPQVASDEALAKAREHRAAALAPLRESHLAGRTDASPDQRLHDLTTLDRAVATADELSDRHAAEAQRAAALAQAERAHLASESSVKAAEKAADELGRVLKAKEAAWLEAFPAAAARFPQLASLRSAADERTAILKLVADAEALGQSLQSDEISLQSQIARLELAERQMGSAADGGIAERVNRAITAVNAHEQGHEAYRRILADHQKANQALAEASRVLAGLEEEGAAWRSDWTQALLQLGLPEDTLPEDAQAAALEWASAGGVLTTLETTQRRLDGMDRDERTLRAKIAAISAELAVTLPEDAVAAAKMLEMKLLAALEDRRRRGELEPDLQAAQLAVDRAKVALAEATDRLDRLCLDAGLPTFEESALASKVAAHRSRCALQERVANLLASLATAGDGVSEEALRTEWQNRDVDRLRAEQEAAQTGADQADAERIAAAEAFTSARAVLSAYQDQGDATKTDAAREAATSELHDVVERYVELSLARDLIEDAIETVRKQQQDPLIARAGALFSTLTRGAFRGIGAEVDAKGHPAVVGERGNESTVTVKEMSDGTRDQLYLAFRLAALEEYARVAEPLPLIADDILVHFDDDRSGATLEVLAQFAKTNQVLLFTHHRSVMRAAEGLPIEAGVRVLSLG